MDPAKSMTVDPTHKLIHKECAACGDDYCALESLPTTKIERDDFNKMSGHWKYVDPGLIKGIRR